MITIEAGRWSARVNPHGGGLASLVHDGEDVVVPQDGRGGHPDYRGAVLAPWPNRLADGVYTFDGRTYQLAVNEPERGAALHGLLADAEWDLRGHTDAEAVLGAAVPATDGYPFEVDVEVGYRLAAESGLTMTLTATNTGTRAAPFGCGFHPYVTHGPDDDLEVPARTYVQTDPERLLPTGTAAVEGSDVDFRVARPVAGAGLDTPYGDLVRDLDDGQVGLRLGSTRVWGGPSVRWLQVYTPAEGGSAAVEPCTCPPDAFASGIDVVRLEPSTSVTMTCGISRPG